MSTVQKVALTAIVILAVFGFVLSVAIKGMIIDGDKKYFNITIKVLTYLCLLIAVAFIVYILGFIW